MIFITTDFSMGLDNSVFFLPVQRHLLVNFNYLEHIERITLRKVDVLSLAQIFLFSIGLVSPIFFYRRLLQFPHQ